MTFPVYNMNPEYPAEEPAQGMEGVDDAISTLHVGGFPPDVTEREVYLLFVTTPGFLHGQLRFDTSGRHDPVAFVMFDTPQNAQAAMEVGNQTLFDPDADRALICKLATSQSRKANFEKRVTSNRPKGGTRIIPQDVRQMYGQQQPAYPQPRPGGRGAGIGGRGGIMARQHAAPWGGYANEAAERFAPYTTEYYGQAPNTESSTLFLEDNEGEPFHDGRIRAIFADLQNAVVKITIRADTRTKAWVMFNDKHVAQQGLSKASAKLKVQFAKQNSRSNE
eukprot:TRINITY_DN5885_c0_g1_i1.p1 TRINITY_DN5885_c0_g1~~TRINITY_DN5885_c0_g1_i1.p1  ORF type:complete len:278 (+),score=84.00 TRINITY_DN5885_c0_g1_i1:31-864(+)